MATAHIFAFRISNNFGFGNTLKHIFQLVGKIALISSLFLAFSFPLSSTAKGNKPHAKKTVAAKHVKASAKSSSKSSAKSSSKATAKSKKAGKQVIVASSRSKANGKMVIRVRGSGGFKSKAVFVSPRLLKDARGRPLKGKALVAARRKAIMLASMPLIVVPPKLSFGELAGLHRAQDELDLKSGVALVIDQDTNEVLFNKNGNTVLPIASLTKLMTGVVVSEARLPMNEPITITQDDVDGERHSWRDGQAVMFDETYIHWARNDADSDRIIRFCDIERPLRSRIMTRVNGEVMQDSNTSDMIFSTARIIAILSEFMTLEPGDLIATGTPSGVAHARKPPAWMKGGDKVEVEVEKIGILANPIVDEA